MALNISRGIVVKAQKITLYGPEGIGKSSFAADFPEPLFIDTEGSTNFMNIARLPRPTSWTMLINQIKEIKNTPGCCKTLVIDTIDWAEQMCVEHICAIHDKKGIESFGYGNGYVYVKEEFGRMLNLLQDVIDFGINVVLTAHAQIRKFEQPDEAGSYDRYELKLGKKTSSQTSPLIKEWADMVLFANYKVHVVTVDKKKKSHGGERVMYTTHHPSWDAKNRHDLAEELPLSYSSIAACIPNNQTSPHTEKSQPELSAESEVSPERIDQTVAETDRYFYHPESDSYWMLKKGEKIPTDQDSGLSSELNKAEWEKGKLDKEATATGGEIGESPPAADSLSDDLSNEQIPKALLDLMNANRITVNEIKQVVAERGYFPIDTPIANYPPGFIDGVLICAWDQVIQAIQEQREIPFN